MTHTTNKKNKRLIAQYRAFYVYTTAQLGALLSRNRTRSQNSKMGFKFYLWVFYRIFKIYPISPIKSIFKIEIYFTPFFKLLIIKLLDKNRIHSYIIN